ncbi:nuclear transport factor 2 family protein [Salinispira pacifica]|uniref:Putative transcription regulator n=1 Tax=Salinispira pacifica TaxID=1307761 RepID=V5WDV7_9SPIO|nr:nuclear transport factor 2 family protein [Salinispira pacifica]AHC13988.1 putative transcription regulator [Salinispira pacifica]
MEDSLEQIGNGLESPEQVKNLWSKTYNTDGKPDWSHIFPYYDDAVVFHDSIQRVEGIDEFKALCNRLTDRCKELKMNIITVVMAEKEVFLQWEMTMMFKKFPSSTLYGTTKLSLNGNGKIIHQRDYYDLWGDIFDNIPWMHHRYRRFMRKKFG